MGHLLRVFYYIGVDNSFWRHLPCKSFIAYSFLYENDHFNQAQAEFKKEANGQSKQVAQKKRVEKRSVCTMHSGTSLVHTLQKMDHLRPSISLLLQLSVLHGRIFTSGKQGGPFLHVHHPDKSLGSG